MRATSFLRVAHDESRSVRQSAAPLNYVNSLFGSRDANTADSQVSSRSHSHAVP